MKNYIIVCLLILTAACKVPTSYSTIPTITKDIMCFGNEPSWSVEISESKKTIHFKQLEGADINFAYSKPTEKRNEQIYNLSKGKDKLKLILTKESCNDGMSDINHAFSSKINFNGTDFKGCGRYLK